MYCVTSIGVLSVTMFLPLNRETYTKWFELDLNTLKPGVEGVHAGVRPRRSTSLAVFSASMTDAGVNEETFFVTFTKASVATQAERSVVFSFAAGRSLCFDAYRSA